MSGGVDSSVAAALLKREGYECVGVFMRLGNDPADVTDEEVELIACSPEKKAAHLEAGSRKPEAGSSHKQGCCSTSDAADARYVAGLLDIPFYALNFQHDFGGIIDYFVREYNAGRTPNPCVRCNEYLKFGKLSRYAKAIGAEFVATGHYARVVREGGEAKLMRGLDHKKDQSYVLFGVPREELGAFLDEARALGVDVRGLMTMPPLAEDPEASRLYFRELRELAREHSLQELSMGTSQDYRVAAEEGATLVRVGAVLFGR